MAKYRKKPIVVEAEQYDGTEESIQRILRMAEGGSRRIHWDKGHLYIETLEGAMKAGQGDYIIKGVSGEVYPCKPDIFKKTYEKVK